MDNQQEQVLDSSREQKQHIQHLAKYRMLANVVANDFSVIHIQNR